MPLLLGLLRLQASTEQHALRRQSCCYQSLFLGRGGQPVPLQSVLSPADPDRKGLMIFSSTPVRCVLDFSAIGNNPFLRNLTLRDNRESG
jgi:hypothetical protein